MIRLVLIATYPQHTFRPMKVSLPAYLYANKYDRSRTKPWFYRYAHRKTEAVKGMALLSVCDETEANHDRDRKRTATLWRALM